LQFLKNCNSGITYFIFSRVRHNSSNSKKSSKGITG
jgi:hypothetical protein